MNGPPAGDWIPPSNLPAAAFDPDVRDMLEAWVNHQTIAALFYLGSACRDALDRYGDDDGSLDDRIILSAAITALRPSLTADQQEAADELHEAIWPGCDCHHDDAPE